MGGPVSLLSWNLNFDPAAWLTQLASGCGNLTYVDDLLGRTRGPGQTLLLYLCLLAATKRVGLRVDDHRCISATINATPDAVASALEPFPIEVSGEAGATLVQHGPVEVYCLLLQSLGIASGDGYRLQRAPCKCRTKHKAVPQDSPMTGRSASLMGPSAMLCPTERASSAATCAGVIGRAKRRPT